LTTIPESADAEFGETFTADLAGSQLDLSHVTTWRGAAPAFIGRRITVMAMRGGIVDLSSLVRVDTGNSSFQALDGGQLLLTSLTTFTAPASTGGVNTLEAHRSGAAVLAPNLTTLVNVDLVLAGMASLPVAGLTTFQHGNILVRQEFGDVGGVLVMPAITIDESDFTGFSPTFQADRAGSRLDLSNVTTWRGAGNASDDTRINVLATNGVVDLSQVAGITAGNTAFQAVNPGSQINLVGLTNFAGAVTGPNANVLDARQGGTIILNSDTTTISNVLVRVDPTGTLTAGTLQLSSGSLLTGSGMVTASLIDDADVQLAAVLTITGSYTQTGAGVLDITIGGTGMGQYGQLMVSGSVSLDGTLNVFLLGNFTPMTGDSFQIVTSAMPLSGTFANANVGPSFMPPTYDAMDVILVAN
jgi:hypothetical protein